MDIVFNVGELKMLAESNEFKPVLGKGVESGNKKTNSEAYKDIEKETKNIYKNLGKDSRGNKTERNDDNKGMSDLRYDNISKPFKERVASQMKGYTSKDAEAKHKNDEFGNADFGDDKVVKNAKEKAKGFKKGSDTAKEIGVTSKNLDKKNIEDKNETMFEHKKIKKLNFHRRFINENHMMSLIPDHLKEENRRFVMSDNKGTEYLVEWHAYEPIVTKKITMDSINEEAEKIKHLYGYNSKDYFNTTSNKERLTEDANFKAMLDRARKLMKG